MTDTPTDSLIEVTIGHARYICRSDNTWFMSWRNSSWRPVPSEAAAILDALAEARTENERLERWKREATEVLTNWDVVAAMVETRPQDLGRSKSDLVAQALAEARARADELRRFVEWTVMSPPISVTERHPWEAVDA